jgi:hypothetical protein
VTLHYLAQSNVRARKNIFIGDNGLSTLPARASAPTQLTLEHVDSSLPRLRGRIAQRIAARRAASSRAQANAIVSDHREHDIREGFDERLNQRVAEIQTQVSAQIAALKIRGDDKRTVMQSRSTPQFVEVALYRSESNSRRPPMPQFEVDGNPDIALRVHRSMLMQVLADGQLRARVAPLIASALQTDLVGGHDTDGQTDINLTDSLRSEWLAIDIIDANAPWPSQRVAAEETGKTSVR